MELVELILLSFVVVLFVISVLQLIQVGRLNKKYKSLEIELSQIKLKSSSIEDLVNQAELRAEKIVEIINKRYKLLHHKSDETKKNIEEMNRVVNKSLEIASLFKEKLPYDEVIQEKIRAKYSKAAELIRGGAKIDVVSSELGLSQGEVGFLKKISQEKLNFDLKVKFQESQGQLQ